jgi:hypothetical protein
MIASLTVLGRANGPILQDLGTVTAGSREVSVEAVIAPPSGCDVNGTGTIQAAIGAKPTNDVTGILCGFQDDLTDNYGQVFKQSDNESWDIKTGRYSRNVSWTFANCDGDGPVTTFCP